MYLARELARRRLLRPTALVSHGARDVLFSRQGIGDSGANRLRTRLLGAVADREGEPIVAAARDVGDDVADHVYREARTLLECHVAAGDVCVVLSSSPHELVEAVSVALGAHHGVGTKAEIRDGRFTGRLDGPFCYGEGKLARLAEQLDDPPLASAVAYSDSRVRPPVAHVGRVPDRGEPRSQAASGGAPAGVADPALPLTGRADCRRDTGGGRRRRGHRHDARGRRHPTGGGGRAARNATPARGGPRCATSASCG